MRRRTFLQLLGVSAAPIPCLVGADLGQAIVEQNLDSDFALIKFITDTNPMYFKIPVEYRSDKWGKVICDSRQNIHMVVKEDFTLKGIQVRAPKKLREFYKSIGVDEIKKEWIDLPVTECFCTAGNNLDVLWAADGLWTIV